VRATLYEGDAASIDVSDVRAWVLALVHVVGLPRLRLMQTIIAAPDRETLVQMQIVGTVIDTLRLRGVIGNGMKFPDKPVHLPWEKPAVAKVDAASS
jgi:hypothetical protein